MGGGATKGLKHARGGGGKDDGATSQCLALSIDGSARGLHWTEEGRGEPLVALNPLEATARAVNGNLHNMVRGGRMEPFRELDPRATDFFHSFDSLDVCWGCSPRTTQPRPIIREGAELGTLRPRSRQNTTKQAGLRLWVSRLRHNIHSAERTGGGSSAQRL